MAFTFSLNNVYESSTAAMLGIKDMLVANGMTLVESGDGAALFSGLGGGDVLTVADPAAESAGNIVNRNAWFRGQWPNGREIVYQRNTSLLAQTTCRMRYSAGAGFTGGTPSATVAPTAVDEAYIVGTAGAGEHMIAVEPAVANPTAGTYAGRSIVHGCFGDADEDYAFWVVTVPRGQRYPGSVLMIDAVANAPSYIADNAVIMAGTYSLDIFAYESNLFDGRPSIAPERYAYTWGTTVKSAANTARVMRSCAAVQWGTNGNPGFEWVNPAYPSNGVILGGNPYSGGYDLFDKVIWFQPSYVYTGTYGGGEGIYVGRSRLLTQCSYTDAYRDISDDLLYRFLGSSIAVAWDGVTDPLL